jgi:hypothetical protein
MRKGLQNDGYCGELFPFVVEGNHGSEDDQSTLNREGGYCWLFKRVCYRPDACDARVIRHKMVELGVKEYVGVCE